MSVPIHEQLAQLECETVAMIKGMIERGDAVDDIAVWFGVNARVVHGIVAGMAHGLVQPAPRWALPPAGPYVSASHAYGALRDVRDAEQRLSLEAVCVRTKYRS